MIPKEKPKPKPQPKAKAEPQPQPERMKDMPLNEELDTKVDQMTPVPADEPNETEQKKQGDEESAQPKKQQKKSEIETVENDNAPVELPEVEKQRRELTDEQVENILNPNDIIDKYAKDGGQPEGEDHVSMQYVKMKYQSYFYKFSRRLYHVWLYPKDAAYRGEQGTVRISFKIARDGMISGINVIKSSGYPDLDREAVNALRKTAGVPLPESYELNFLKVDAYFQYILNKGFMVY